VGLCPLSPEEEQGAPSEQSTARHRRFSHAMGESRDSAPAAHRSTGTIRAEDISRTMLRVDDARLFGVCRWGACRHRGWRVDRRSDGTRRQSRSERRRKGRTTIRVPGEIFRVRADEQRLRVGCLRVRCRHRQQIRVPEGTYDVGISSLSISASATSRLRSLHLTRRKRAIYHDGRLLDRATRRPVRSARQGIRRGRRSHTHQGRLCDQERLRRHQA